MEKKWNGKSYVVNDYENYALKHFSDNEKNFERDGLKDCLNQLVFIKATFREIHEKHNQDIKTITIDIRQTKWLSQKKH